MNKYFIAGVGRCLLFRGSELFADARTLTDSSITLGVTAEDIRGGEGNKLWGQYFHDSSFSMKLTDCMFSLEYLAAQVGASDSMSAGSDIFKSETLAATSDHKLELTETAVPIQSGAEVYAWIRPAADGSADQVRKVVTDNKIELDSTVASGTEYCVLYRYNNDAAKEITVSAQFIPDTLHAVLTVALYSGDSCNVEASTKVGEVTIDIPRFQLSGSADLTMSATGASQTPLEGNALASGCSGCDGDGVYATITKVIFNANWYDDCTQIILENSSRAVSTGTVSEQFVAYACYSTGVPKAIDASKITWTIDADGTGLAIDNTGKVTGTATAGTAVVHAAVTAKTSLKATGVIVVSA